MVIFNNDSWIVLLLIVTHVLNCKCNPSSDGNHLYIVPFASLISNNRNGSFAHPYSSLQEALDCIEQYSLRGIFPQLRTTLHLYPTYYFGETLRIKQTHSHIRLNTMRVADTDFYQRMALGQHSHQRLKTATMSGGVPITGWTQVSGNTYSATVPSLSYVNQLFINNQRIVRTRVPTNFSDYLQYAASLNDPVRGRYGFQYQPGQFDYKSLADAMVVVYHSWTESHHYIDQLITANNTVFFTNPSDQPIGTFGIQGQQRFHIENLCEALIPNSFCFVNETKTVYLMTDGSYNPNDVQVITPVKEIVLLLAGDDVDHPVEDVIINDVMIQHGAWHIDRYQQADAADAGFLKFATFIVANASLVVLSNIEISHTGAYGLWINAGTEKIDFLNSLITDTGAGGIWIGRELVLLSQIANSIKIISNEISYGGNVFPCGVGIVDSTSSDVIIADNIIHHQRYNGISIGSSIGYDPTGTKNVLVQGNYIYSIGQHVLCDQGGIYTIGALKNTVIHGNVIKNVFSYSVLMWGIYLDEGTSDVIVSNNVVYNTGWSALFQNYGANNTIVNNVFARASANSPPLHPQDPPPDGDIRIFTAENHTSWIFTTNIVYDISRQVNQTVYGPPNGTMASFSNNLYYNLYGATLLFGYPPMSFADWQKTGQDNSSLIADPLFAGDINQCDFFTIQSNSPAAKLGFVNITKLSRWTPGCATEDNTNNNQFYHW